MVSALLMWGWLCTYLQIKNITQAMCNGETKMNYTQTCMPSYNFVNIHKQICKYGSWLSWCIQMFITYCMYVATAHDTYQDGIAII